MGFNWQRIQDPQQPEYFFLDHYCTHHQPASGEDPWCSTFRDFIVGDALSFFVFNLGQPGVATAQKLSVFFCAAEAGTGAPTSPIPTLAGGQWHDIPLTAGSATSWVYAHTAGVWVPASNSFTVDVPGRYFFSAKVEIQDADPATTNEPPKVFGFDPELVVDEGTGGEAPCDPHGD